MENRQDKLSKIAFLSLLLYTFAGFVFSHVNLLTSTLMVYVSFLLITGLFCLLIIKYQCRYIRRESLFVLPYILITIAGYISQSRIENACWWIICLCIILLSQCTAYNLDKRFPYKLLFAIGVISSLGVLVELFLPSVYINYIAPLFKEASLLIRLRSVSGFAGFTYQLDTTAMPIIYASFVLLYLKNLNPKAKILLYGVSVLCVFLAGKRMLSLIILLVPLLVYLISKKQMGTKMIVLISILVISFIGISYIYSHAGQLEGNIFLRRFARMIVDSQAGGDVTSNRNSLYEIAWGFFRSSPLFGVGVGQFAVLEGSTDVHNTYLQVLCEQGIVGFIPYLISIIYTLFVSVTNIKRYPGKNAIIKFCFAVQLVYVFYCFTGNLNTNLFGYMIYYCAIGIQFAYINTLQDSIQESER